MLVNLFVMNAKENSIDTNTPIVAVATGPVGPVWSLAASSTHVVHLISQGEWMFLSAEQCTAGCKDGDKPGACVPV